MALKRQLPHVKTFIPPSHATIKMAEAPSEEEVGNKGSQLMFLLVLTTTWPRKS